MKIQQQLEDQQDMFESRQRAIAQEHALAMSNARDAADKRYVLLQEHHDEALDAVKKNRQ